MFKNTIIIVLKNKKNCIAVVYKHFIKGTYLYKLTY